MAYAYSKSGNEKNAEETYSYICSINNSTASVPANYNLGTLYMRQGRLQEAVKRFRAALYKQSQHIKSRFNLARAYQRMGMNVAAYKEYIKILQVENQHYKSLLNLAQLKMDEDRHEQAHNYLQQATTSSAAGFSAFYKLALCQEHLHNKESAIKSLRRALTYKDSPKAWHKLATISHDLGLLQETQIAAEHAHRLEPTRHKYVYLLAKSHAELKQEKLATHFYSKAVELDESDYLSWYNLGLSHYRQGAFQEARFSFRRGTIINPDAHKAWYMLGLSHYNCESFNEAIKYFSTAIQNGANYRAHYNLALCHIKINNDADAETHFRLALDQHPLHHASLSGLAKCCSRVGKYSESLRICNKLLSIDSDDCPHRYVFKILLNNGETSHAESLIRSIPENNPLHKSLLKLQINN